MNEEFIRERLGDPTSVWNRLQYDRDGIIEASAGTGKTYALQSIVLKLLVEKRVESAKNILLVTFTEKAAGELKDRIRSVLESADVLPTDFEEMTICTIHSFCRELLSEYAFENGVPMTFEIGGAEADLFHRAVRHTLLGAAFREKYAAFYSAKMAEDDLVATDELVAEAEAALAALVRGTPHPPKTTEFALELAEMSEAEFRRLKADSSFLTFDDLVVRACEVIEREAEREGRGERSELLETIRKRYRIALVDEFQDTDERQWTIFSSIFAAERNRLDAADCPVPKQGFLLVVGDPKQAIYGFRGADIETYLRARSAILENQPAQTLSATFRSSPSLVTGLNAIFQSSAWFSEMHTASGSINYTPVESPPQNERFAGLEDLTGREAITLLESLPGPQPKPTTGRSGYGNKTICLPVFARAAAREMARLKALPVAYRTKDPRTGEVKAHRLSYRDMCVLVHDSGEAAVVRQELSRARILYSQYKERGLFDSAEAETLIALFDFLAEPGRSGNLAALLLTPLFGVPPWRVEEKLAQGDAKVMSLLDRWQELTRTRNWNQLFESVMGETELAHPRSDDGDFDRRWAATRQILDRLLTEVGRKALSVGDFAATLRKWRKTEVGKGEDAALRQTENESDCVQIMTMHASKGLEFKVVFVATGFSPSSSESAERQEEVRLFYVALTRAEHKLYLPWSKWAAHTRIQKKETVEECGIGSAKSPLLGEGFLSQGIQAWCAARGLSPANATAADLPISPPRPDAAESVETPAVAEALPTVYAIPSLRGRRMRWDSFSSLKAQSALAHLEPMEATEVDEADGDTETVRASHGATLLPRTAVSGTVFHEIMERLCRNNECKGEVGFSVGKLDLETALAETGGLMDIVRRAMRRNAVENSESGDDSTERTLGRMAWNALNTEIVIGSRHFCLKDIDAANRLAEVEFAIDESAALGSPLPGRDGVFNGSVDLLVRPEGKDGPVCVLDWKTNSLPDYSAERIEAAMDEAGYPLQFKLYTLAVNRWLGEGAVAGVAYLFVRGGEFTGSAGVYAREMDAALLAECHAAVERAIARN